MAKRLENRNTLITGATRGIGYAIAERFAEEGANVFVNARNPETCQEVAEKLGEHDVKTGWYACDVSDQGAVKNLVKAAEDAFGQVDVLVNNAGVYRPARFLDYSFEDFSAVVSTNLYSVFHMCQAVLPGMMQRTKGKIVNIASTAGKWGSRNQSAYNASKHAIVGLTRCIGLEAAPFNINVNAICPWFVDTDLIPQALEAHGKIVGAPPEAVLQGLLNSGVTKRLVTPEEVAHLAVYLASDESDMMNCQAISLDGGYTMI